MDDTHELAFGDDEESIGALIALNRGLIIQSYAHVEFILADFVVRCSNDAQFTSALPASFPYKLEKRLACLRRIFALPGRLDPYRSEVLPLIDKLMSFEMLRHMMTHGLMIMYYNAERPDLSLARFRRYDVGKNKVLEHYSAELTLLQLSKTQFEVSRYSNEVIMLIVKVLEALQLSLPQGSVAS